MCNDARVVVHYRFLAELYILTNEFLIILSIIFYSIVLCSIVDAIIYCIAWS
jgi:hypothetical protein